MAEEVSDATRDILRLHEQEGRPGSVVNRQEPTIEEIIRKATEPTIDEILANSQKKSWLHQNPYEFQGPIADENFSNGRRGNFMESFGVGFSSRWGTSLTPEREAWLKKNGLMTDQTEGGSQLVKMFNEQLIRSAVAGWDILTQTPRATAEGLLQEGHGFEAVGGPLAATLEAFPEFRVGGQPHLNIVRDIESRRIRQAVENGTIGPERRAINPPAELTRRLVDEDRKALSNETLLPAEPTGPAPPPPTDVHGMARQMEPDLFHEYDVLSEARSQLSDLITNARESNPLTAEIDKILGEVRGAEYRLTNRKAIRLELLRRENVKISPEVEELQREQNAIDVRMRELAPDISGAMDRAREALPVEPTVEPGLSLEQQITNLEGQIRRNQGRLQRADNVAERQARKQLLDQQEAQLGELRGQLPRPVVESLDPVIDPIVETAVPNAPHTVTTITPEIFRAEIQRQGGDAGKASDTLAAQVDEALNNGQRVVLRVDGKAVEITSVNHGMMTDAQGQRWGTLSLATARDVNNRVDILSQRRQSIARETARALQAAGRPAEEAQLHGAIIQAYYETMGPRVGMTARDLFDQEAPSIVSGTGKTRGGYQISENIIRLIEGKSDATTFMHETAHNWLEQLRNFAEDRRATPELKADVAALNEWLSQPERGKSPGYRRQQEKFAVGFERYLMEGTAPSPKLANVFSQLADWFRKIYSSLSERGTAIPPEIRDVYDRLLSKPITDPIIAPERFTREGPSAADVLRDERNAVGQLLPGEIEGGRQRARETPPRDTVSSAGGQESVVAAGADVGEESTAKRGGGTRTPAGVPKDGNERLQRAGNIRLDNLNLPEEVDNYIRDVAEANGGFVAERRGRLSDGEVLDLSNDSGIAAAFIDPEKVGPTPGRAYTAEEVLALRQLLRTSATSVWNMMRDLNDALVQRGRPPVELAASLQEAITRHRMIQGKVAGATAEAGRALRAFREFKGDEVALGDLLKTTDGITVDQLYQLARWGSRLQTTSQVGSFVNRTGQGISRAISFYYANALISGPITHTFYIASNWAHALVITPIDVAAAAVPGVARRLMGTANAADRVRIQELKAVITGLGQGFVEGLTAGGEAFMQGQQLMLPGQRAPVSAFHGGYAAQIPGIASWTLGLPSRMVAGIHQQALQMRYAQRLNQLIAREAYASPNPSVTMAQLKNNVPTRLMQDAADYSLSEMYMRRSDFNEFLSKAERAAHHSVLGEIMFPFMKIGWEITRKGTTERIPLFGAVSALRERGVFGAELRAGGARFDEAVGKQFVGMGVMATGAMMALNEIITDFGPTNPNERDIWLMTHTPYSVRIGDLTIDFERIGPIGKPLMFAADMVMAQKHWNGKEKADLAFAYTEALSRVFVDETWFRGMKDLTNAVFHQHEYAERYIGNVLGNFITPAAIFQVGQYFDPYTKEAHGILDQIRARMPGYSGLQDKRDLFGEPIERHSVIHYGPEKYANERSVQEMQRMHFGIARPDRKIGGVELTPEQYDDVARIGGRLTRMALDKVVNSPGYQKASDGIKTKWIHDEISHSRKMARIQVMMQARGTDNDIVAKSGEAKRELLGVTQ